MQHITQLTQNKEKQKYAEHIEETRKPTLWNAIRKQLLSQMEIFFDDIHFYRYAFVYIFTCIYYVSAGSQGNQKGASDPLKLELHVSHPARVLGTDFWYLFENSKHSPHPTHRFSPDQSVG